jgi:hypothetical protein
VVRFHQQAFTRIRDAVAALPVESAVIDGEAVLMRSDNTFDFEGLRSREGQADAILVAYNVPQPVLAKRQWPLRRQCSSIAPMTCRPSPRPRPLMSICQKGQPMT